MEEIVRSAITIVPARQVETIRSHRIRDLWADPAFRAAAEAAIRNQDEEGDGGNLPPIAP